MEVVSRLIKVQFPNYLKSLPIPSTFGGFAKLSGNEWVQLVPFVVTTSVVVYLVISAILPSKPSKKTDADWVNKTEQKEKEKVADIIQIEELGEKTAFCRCWKSKKVCAYPPFLFLIIHACALWVSSSRSVSLPNSMLSLFDVSYTYLCALPTSPER